MLGNKYIICIKEAARVLSSFFLFCGVVLYGTLEAFAQEGPAQGGNLAINAEVVPSNRFIYPVDYAPMSLSGTYGELRSNHFHGGVDFRVGGVSGAPIFASADGYVSRISVSPGGYGNALYLTHSNGFVTVYGHMQKYADEIQKFVRGKQYEKKSFAVTLDLDSTAFPVRQGEIIGYAGNTGSSGGPHLHFEIRDEENVPLDYLERGYIKTVDNLPPVFNRVEFFGYSYVYGAPKTFLIERPSEAGAVIKVPMFFYVAIDAVDKMEGTNAKLAVKEYKVFLDSEPVYDLVIGDVPFDEGRYINSLTEYSLRAQRGKSFIKSYVEPGNMLAYKIDAANDGIIVLPDTLQHKVSIEVIDYKGNKAVKSYKVKRVDSLYTSQMGDKPEGSHMAWHLANIYERDGFKLTLPAASLYSSIYFTLDSAEVRATPYAPVWKIHRREVPLHTPGNVSIKYSGPDSLASKALLASVSASGKLSGAGGEVVDGFLSGKLYSFGNYTVAIDTVAPSVAPNFKNWAVVNGNVILLTIRDRLSGIKSYRVEIDGHWVVAEFDAKSARLRIPLKDARLKRGIMHKMVARVVDNKGNETIVRRSFKW